MNFIRQNLLLFFAFFGIPCIAIEPSCFLPYDSGSCDSEILAKPGLRWYYSNERFECLAFSYTGCGGNDNNFEDKQACQRFCKPSDGPHCSGGEEPLKIGDGENTVTQQLCADLECPAGWVCRQGFAAASCCNATIQEYYESGLSSSCPNGQHAFTIKGQDYDDTLVAARCKDIQCPGGYNCQRVNPLFAKCCLNDGESKDKLETLKLDTALQDQAEWKDCKAAQHERLVELGLDVSFDESQPHTYIPECTQIGAYAPKQCDTLAGFCWCVDTETGMQVPDTRLPVEEAVDCESCANRVKSIHFHITIEHNLGTELPDAVFVPSCQESGDFTPKQCFFIRNHDECWCVDEKHGIEIEDTRTSVHSDQLYCLGCTVQRRHILLQLGLDAGLDDTHDLNVFVPECLPDGTYSPLQCNFSIHQCWCVDVVRGTEVSATRNRADAEFHCEGCELRRKNIISELGLALGLVDDFSEVYAPTCQANGFYEPTQCDPMKSECWCVDVVTGLETALSRTNIDLPPLCDGPPCLDLVTTLECLKTFSHILSPLGPIRTSIDDVCEAFDKFEYCMVKETNCLLPLRQGFKNQFAFLCGRGKEEFADTAKCLSGLLNDHEFLKCGNYFQLLTLIRSDSSFGRCSALKDVLACLQDTVTSTCDLPSFSFLQSAVQEFVKGFIPGCHLDEFFGPHTLLPTKGTLGPFTSVPTASSKLTEDTHTMVVPTRAVSQTLGPYTLLPTGTSSFQPATSASVITLIGHVITQTTTPNLGTTEHEQLTSKKLITETTPMIGTTDQEETTKRLITITTPPDLGTTELTSKRLITITTPMLGTTEEIPETTPNLGTTEEEQLTSKRLITKTTPKLGTTDEITETTPNLGTTEQEQLTSKRLITETTPKLGTTEEITETTPNLGTTEQEQLTSKRLITITTPMLGTTDQEETMPPVLGTTTEKLNTQTTRSPPPLPGTTAGVSKSTVKLNTEATPSPPPLPGTSGATDATAKTTTIRVTGPTPPLPGTTEESGESTGTTEESTGLTGKLTSPTSHSPPGMPSTTKETGESTEKPQTPLTPGTVPTMPTPVTTESPENITDNFTVDPTAVTHATKNCSEAEVEAISKCFERLRHSWTPISFLIHPEAVEAICEDSCKDIHVECSAEVGELVANICSAYRDEVFTKSVDCIVKNWRGQEEPIEEAQAQFEDCSQKYPLALLTPGHFPSLLIPLHCESVEVFILCIQPTTVEHCSREPINRFLTIFDQYVDNIHPVCSAARRYIDDEACEDDAERKAIQCDLDITELFGTVGNIEDDAVHVRKIFLSNPEELCPGIIYHRRCVAWSGCTSVGVGFLQGLADETCAEYLPSNVLEINDCAKELEASNDTELCLQTLKDSATADAVLLEFIETSEFVPQDFACVELPGFVYCLKHEIERLCSPSVQQLLNDAVDKLEKECNAATTTLQPVTTISPGSSTVTTAFPWTTPSTGGPCFTARQKALENKDATIPQCQITGQYHLIQCNFESICWCVDPDSGQPLNDVRVGPATKLPKCGVDKVITCRKEPPKPVCPVSGAKPQLVFRWYKAEGVCIPYYYTYCSEEAFNAPFTVKRKTDCQNICFNPSFDDSVIVLV